jgi:perosamine synthetase
MRAIYASLKSLRNIDKRGEVILPRFSCPTFAHAIMANNLEIKYCDINPKTLSIDMSSLNALDTKNCLALICVNHFGLANQMDEIKDYCRDRGLYLIEDLGYSLGTEYRGRTLGSFGDFSVLNFKEGKALPLGGGMMTTSHPELVEWLKNRRAKKSNPLRILGYKLVVDPGMYWLFRKSTDYSGINARRIMSSEDTIRHSREEYDFHFNPSEHLYSISDFQGRMGSLLLKDLDSQIKVRMDNAKKIMEVISGVEHVNPVIPEENASKIHYIRFPIMVDAGKRRKTLSDLIKCGIEARDIYSEVKPDPKKHPGSYKVSKQILTLPCHPSMTQKDIEKIGDILK